MRPRNVRIVASILMQVNVMGLYAAEPGPLTRRFVLVLVVVLVLESGHAE
jgi:hypothetical protein